jgi:hypothetical protein
MNPSFEDEHTILTAALVCRIDVAKWKVVKAAVLDSGGEILYQRLAVQGVFLRIVEEARP